MKKADSEDGGMDEEFELELKKAEQDLGSRLNDADGLTLLEDMPKTADSGLPAAAPAKKKGKKGRRMLSEENVQIGFDGLFA